MTSGMVDCDGQRIAFRASTGQGPSVLLIHGNSSSSGAYARQLEGEIGTPPLAVPANLADSFFDHPAMAHGFTATLTSEQALAYAASFFRPGADVPTPFHTDVMNTDGVARAQIAASIVPDGYRDEVKVVAGMDRPLAILHGTQEQLVNGRFFTGLAMPTLWRGAVQELTGAGHAPQWETPDEFDALLGAFVADCQRI